MRVRVNVSYVESVSQKFSGRLKVNGLNIRQLISRCERVGDSIGSKLCAFRLGSLNIMRNKAVCLYKFILDNMALRDGFDICGVCVILSIDLERNI